MVIIKERQINCLNYICKRLLYLKCGFRIQLGFEVEYLYFYNVYRYGCGGGGGLE